MFYSNRSDKLCLFNLFSCLFSRPVFPESCKHQFDCILRIESGRTFFGPFAIVPLWLDTLHVHRVRVGQHGYKIDRRLKEYTCMYGPDLQFFK